MSIQKYGKRFVPICDICGAELIEERDFWDAVNAKKEAGWRNRYVDGEWEDVCLDCQKEEEEER